MNFSENYHFTEKREKENKFERKNHNGNTKEKQKNMENEKQKHCTELEKEYGSAQLGRPVQLCDYFGMKTKIY